MTSFVVVLAAQAEDDIRKAFLWYRERNAHAAGAFRVEVFDMIDAIQQTPLSRAVDEDGNRKRILKRYPYSIFYEVLGNTVTVLAVAHHRRRPGYWQTKRK